MAPTAATPHPLKEASPTPEHQPEVGRRAILGLSLAATVGFLVAGNPRPVQAAVGTSPRLAAPTAVPSLWPGALRSVQPVRGVIKTYEDVYVMTSISQVATMTTKSGAFRLALTMTGKSNQLQIIDPIRGIREKVFSLPDNLMARGLVWDPKNRTLYVGVTTGRIFSFNYDTSKLIDLGKVAPKASSLYGLNIDSTGRLWGGSYPQGIIWNYTPKTKKFAQLPRLDGKTDYVRGVGITADDTVYVGTGSTYPKVVCFPAKSPAKRTTLKLPELPKTGFAHTITVNGDHVLINADDVPTQLIWNHRTKKATTAALPKSQRKTAGSPTSQTNYWISGKKLYSTNAATGQDTLLGEVGVFAPEHIWAAAGCVYILSREGTQAKTHKFDLATKRITLQSSTTLKGAGVGVHSLLAHTDGKIYIGGYMGEGIATLNPDTGERWQSLDTVAPNQISGMIQWNGTRTFLGSYGSADIIRFVTPRAKEGRIAFHLMERLRTNYGQSRPIGWAKNKTRVFFGTVPEYGLAGGALGILNPSTDKIEKVYNKLIPNHSIVGLAANDQFVYGTTSTRNGYGIPDTKGNAKVFAFDLMTKKLAWSRDIPGYKAVLTPVLVDDKIIAATLEGIVVLDAANGKLLQKHSFTGRLDKHYRPGWLNASVKRLGESYRFVHAKSGQMHVLDLQNGTLCSVEGSGDTGPTLTVSEGGRVFVSHKTRGMAEISVDPLRPGILSTADLVSVTSTGALTVRPSNRKGAWGAVKVLDTGWNAKTIKSLHVVDWQSRGVMDLLVQRTDGSLNLHQANGRGTYPQVGRRLSGGWAARQIAVGRMSATANEPAMVSADTAGNLYLHEISKSTGVMRAAKRLGTGFKGYNLSLLDVYGKGYADVVGHKGAGLSCWENTGNGRISARRELRTQGWSGMTHVGAVKGHYGQYEGLVYRTKAGEMNYISAKNGQLAGIISSGIKLDKDVVAGG